MRWIEQGRGPVTIEFQGLVDATVDDRTLLSAISDLVSAKREGAELDRGPRIPAISDFVEKEIVRLGQMATERVDPVPDVHGLNDLFRSTLTEVWQNEQPT